MTVSSLTLVQLLLATVATSCSFSPNPQTPNDASPFINPNFIGYHYETATWVAYATNLDGSVNEYSKNMFAVAPQRTGGVPIIRLGGSDCDYAQFIPSQQEACLPPITRSGGRSFNLTIGQQYWEICKNFDDLDAQYVIQVPVGRINLTESLVWANTSWDTLGQERIQAIEILNEPQFYPDQPYFDGPGYIGQLTNQSLIDLFHNHSVPISSALGLDRQRVFQAPDGGWTNHLNWNLPIPELLELGLDSNGQIRQVSQHYYPFSVGGPNNPGLNAMQALLFNHSRNTAAFDFLPLWLQYLDTAADGNRMPFIWGEVTAALGFEPGFQASFGNALWNLDTFLYSMVLGVDSIQYSENLASYFLLWLPQDTDGMKAATGAPFYFVPLIADFIGNTSKSQAVELQADIGTENSNIVAYAAYEDNSPQRLALINLDFWGSYEISGNVTIAPPSGPKQLRNTTTALPGLEPRGVEPVTVNVPEWCTSVLVRRMSAGLGAYALGPNVTYGGSQWTYESLGKEVKDVTQDTELLKVDKGSIIVNMPATSAALLLFS